MRPFFFLLLERYIDCSILYNLVKLCGFALARPVLDLPNDFPRLRVRHRYQFKFKNTPQPEKG